MTPVRAKWTKEETELFKKVYPVKTSKQMKEIFPQYTWQQMLTKANGLGITKGKEVASESRRQNLNNRIEEEFWSDEDKRTLLEVYPKKGLRGVYEALNKKRTISGINRMVRRLNVKRKQNHLMWDQTSVTINKQNRLSVEVTYKGW